METGYPNQIHFTAKHRLPTMVDLHPCDGDSHKNRIGRMQRVFIFTSKGCVIPNQPNIQIILKDDNCERVRLANQRVFANPEQVEDQLLLIPFTLFAQMEQMGNTLAGSPSFNPMGVTEIGLMAIKPTVVGEFQIEFEEWGLYF